MTQATTTTNAKDTTTMPRKPTAPKTWSFEIKVAKEIPVPQRAPGRRLPFDWDAMQALHKKGQIATITVPKEFWLEFSGLADAKASDANRNKEAIRRSFYAWRDVEGKAERKKIALAFSDQYDANRNYLGVEVYMTDASGQGVSAKKKAA